MRARTISLATIAAAGLLVASLAVGAAPHPTDAIGVHGAWTIEVYDADGTLDARQEFHNDLALNGDRVLATLLAGEGVAGDWRVNVGEFGADGVCETSEPTFCRLLEGDGTDDDQNFWGLEVNLSPDASTLLLSGSAEASVDGTIDHVKTIVDMCEAPDLSPADCSTDLSRVGFTFTETDIAPVDVAAGQIFQVEVEITFETAS